MGNLRSLGIACTNEGDGSGRCVWGLEWEVFRGVLVGRPDMVVLALCYTIDAVVRTGQLAL